MMAWDGVGRNLGGRVLQVEVQVPGAGRKSFGVVSFDQRGTGAGQVRRGGGEVIMYLGT